MFLAKHVNRFKLVRPETTCYSELLCAFIAASEKGYK